MDKERIRAGEEWGLTISKAIEKSSYFIALLSKNSVGKRGFVQKELRKALDLLGEFPPDGIFVIPVRLDHSEPQHQQLSKLHRVDLFLSYDNGLARICEAMDLQVPDKEPENHSRVLCSRSEVVIVIPDHVFISIRKKAAADHPDDDSTRIYEIKNRVQA